RGVRHAVAEIRFRRLIVRRSRTECSSGSGPSIPMASPALRRKREPVRERHSPGESAALRVSATERPEEIIPILLEEIVELGFRGAVALELDFDTGQIKPSASMNCTADLLQQFHTSLWASENPYVTSL